MAELDPKGLEAAARVYARTKDNRDKFENMAMSGDEFVDQFWGNYLEDIEPIVTAYLSAQESVGVDVADLVTAARIVAFEDQSPEALKRLDVASEAFADRVPWEDEPASLTKGDG